MKIFRILLLVMSGILIWSCTEDDSFPTVEFTESPSFTVMATDDPAVYIFENTTANGDAFYSFWQVEGDSNKYAEDAGLFQYQFPSSGSYTVTLSMMDSNGQIQTASQVVMPDIPFDGPILTNPENLIQNGYFLEDLANWNVYNGGGRESISNNAFVGDKALQVTNPEDGDPWSFQFVTDAVPTINGATYTVSLWAKGEAATIRFSTNPGVGGDQYGGDYTVGTEWGQYSFTFTANSDETLFALDMGATGATFLIDAVELVRGSSPMNNPMDNNNVGVMNGSFENGLDNWNGYNGGDRVTAEMNEVFQGLGAARVVNPEDGDPWSTQFVTDAFPTVNGAEYTVSAWLKGEPVTIRYSTNPGVGGDQYAGDYQVTSDWAQYEWVFTANSDETLLALDMGANAGTFFLDHVTIRMN